LSNRTLRLSLAFGGARGGGVVARVDCTLRGDLHRCSGDSDDSFLDRLCWCRGGDVDDGAVGVGVESSSESVDTNSLDFYCHPVSPSPRLAGVRALHARACSMSASVAGVPSIRQPCCMIR